MTAIKPAFARLVLFGAVLCALVWSAAAGSDAKQAVERYLHETDENPQSVDGWVRLSEAYLLLAADTGDPDRVALADSAVSTALVLAPVDVRALNQLSHVRSAQHRYEDILHIQRESIFYGLTNAESWGVVGDANMDLGRYRSADSCYYTMYELDPGFESQVRVARRLFDIGEFSEAVLYIKAAIDTARAGGEPGGRALADAYVRLGEMYLSRGDWGSATACADTSLGIVTDYITALELKAEVHCFERNFVDSRAIYERLVTLSGDPGYLAGLARAVAGEGDDVKADSLVVVAADIYKRSYKNHPDIIRRDYVAFLLEWDLELELAQQLAYEESRQRRDVYTYDLLAWAYYKKENYNLAWSSIALALRKDAKHPRIIYHAAVVAKAAGKNEKYETYAARVRDLNPRFEAMYGSF